ncbi:MAG: tRNA (adenosine(37)-N6)-threonylcarbamoyltransferase complex ATPase subunit type 1 TsaE [Gemmatimonadetes bacterium]|nr:tRNA (adenosine(37)-N6)-threonylcarbamoyltransferase complex ATPase subunit type 1 TsaE [Gemmatimonadota bacterium]
MPEYTLAQLEEAAGTWWRRLAAGSVVWLSGELGAGKTALVQALARAAGAEPARSPSFALVHEYPSPEGPLIHVDCYRLRRPEEALDLDLTALADRARLLLIEWPERAGALAPAPDLHLRLAHVERGDRRAVESVP